VRCGGAVIGGRRVKAKSKRSGKWPTAVDLYCGSGAVTAALKQVRFRVVAAVDNDAVACETYRLNHPATHLVEADIQTVDPALIRKSQLQNKDLDLLVVCAPCQPFSSQNRKRGRDARSQLILQAGRFAQVLRPRLIFFENVPGLASEKNSRLRARLKRELGSDYILSSPESVDAADFGVPQRRIRCIMLAKRKAQPPSFPEPITPAGSRVTVRDAIGGMKRLRSGGVDLSDDLHVARKHSQIALDRLSAIPKNGGSRSSLPEHLVLACHSDLETSKFSDVYGRMKWNDVAPTLTTGCTDVTRGRFAHPTANRAITLREASLLQTFPSNYRFSGSTSDIQRQIGNAVPVQLIKAFGPVLKAGIGKSKK
jgi:DNA (cytosine-5)-methyltransferase 1